jgi:malonyl-CoA/methylmalonyl-CoA synthetase
VIDPVCEARGYNRRALTLSDLFASTFVERASAPALEWRPDDGPARTFTFADLDRRANSMARALAARGAARGERVAVQVSNSPAFIDIFLACLRLGAIVVPVNVLYREREVRHILDDAEPRVFVTDAQAAPDAAPAGSVSVRDLEVEAEAASDAPVAVALDGDAPAALVYTSGTTGRSKGAILTHNNFVANTAGLLASWRITADDRYLGVLPLFHVHGLGNGVCCWLASGCLMRLAPRFEASRAAALFEEFRPTLFFGVPTIYVRLLELSERDARRIGGRGRLFVSGSAPLPAAVHQAFRARFGHTILERYGMSETLMLTGNLYAGERRPGTVGWPMPGVSVRLSTADGTAPGPGEIGRVLVRGSNVGPGYWRNPPATAAAFRDGWFDTGDLAECSRDGCYTLRGRASDLIISGGFNIYPREIEEWLLEQPGVREAAVAAAPDPRRGEVPVAYVVVDGAFDEDALREACGRAFASFKQPRAFVRLDALPRNALGKVQKHRLERPGGEGRTAS